MCFFIMVESNTTYDYSKLIEKITNRNKLEIQNFDSMYALLFTHIEKKPQHKKLQLLDAINYLIQNKEIYDDIIIHCRAIASDGKVNLNDTWDITKIILDIIGIFKKNKINQKLKKLSVLKAIYYIVLILIFDNTQTKTEQEVIQKIIKSLFKLIRVNFTLKTCAVAACCF